MGAVIMPLYNQLKKQEERVKLSQRVTPPRSLQNWT